MADFLIQGERITLPVEIREAGAVTAMFSVRSAPARSLIAYSGLDVFEPVAGRAICSLAFVRYLDGDLGPYHEFAVAFLVRAPERGGKRPGAFIHQLPVNQSFTLQAGRTIWGFPKQMMDIEVSTSGGKNRCAVRDGDDPIVELRTAAGLPTPTRDLSLAVDAYSHLDGTTWRTPWQFRPSGVRARPAGASLVLGEHPIADELRTLGLPKTPLLTSSIHRLGMTFYAAEDIK